MTEAVDRESVESRVAVAVLSTAKVQNVVFLIVLLLALPIDVVLPSREQAQETSAFT
jgi:hypothetical protein